MIRRDNRFFFSLTRNDVGQARLLGRGNVAFQAIGDMEAGQHHGGAESKEEDFEHFRFEFRFRRVTTCPYSETFSQTQQVGELGMYEV